MEKPSTKTIEITVISAEGLLINKKQPAKKTSLFITVKIDPFNSRSTGSVPEGGSYPSWNEKLIMELPLHARFVTVEAQSGSRIIGTAKIPVSDFAGAHLPDNHLSFLSYRLRDSSGQKNGIINLSMKVNGAGNGGCAASCSRPWMGVQAVGNKVSGGIVTGIPVAYRY